MIVKYYHLLSFDSSLDSSSVKSSMVTILTSSVGGFAILIFEMFRFENCLNTTSSVADRFHGNLISSNCSDSSLNQIRKD